MIIEGLGLVFGGEKGGIGKGGGICMIIEGEIK